MFSFLKNFFDHFRNIALILQSIAVEKFQENNFKLCWQFPHQHVASAHDKTSYLFTYLGEFRMSVLDARTHEIYDLLTGHEIPDPITCEDHKFVFCWVNHKSPDIRQCCYHLFLGRQTLRLFVCVVAYNRKTFMEKIKLYHGFE